MRRDQFLRSLAAPGGRRLRLTLGAGSKPEDDGLCSRRAGGTPPATRAPGKAMTDASWPTYRCNYENKGGAAGYRQRFVNSIG